MVKGGSGKRLNRGRGRSWWLLVIRLVQSLLCLGTAVAGPPQADGGNRVRLQLMIAQPAFGRPTGGFPLPAVPPEPASLGEVG